MQFTPTVDFGHVLTVVIAVLAWLGSQWHRETTVGTALTEIKGEQVEAKQRVEELKTQLKEQVGTLKAQFEKVGTSLDVQTNAMGRMEERVIDPLRRFASMETELTEQAKIISRSEAHIQDLERRFDEARDEVMELRKWRHDLEKPAQMAVLQNAIANERARQAEQRGAE